MILSSNSIEGGSNTLFAQYLLLANAGTGNKLSIYLKPVQNVLSLTFFYRSARRDYTGFYRYMYVYQRAVIAIGFDSILAVIFEKRELILTDELMLLAGGGGKALILAHIKASDMDRFSTIVIFPSSLLLRLK
jgi:hypothetical protein